MQVKLIEVTDIFENTKSRLLKKAISSGNKVFAFKLPKFKGLLGFEIQPGRRIGTELADVAKRFGLGGILHSDELPNYGISVLEIENLKRRLEVGEEDGYIMIVGKENTVKIVAREIVNRINEMLTKIPKDTRQAKPDGTTSFLRPQPGSARMYPETDHPLIYLDRFVENHEGFDVIIYKIRYGNINEELKLIKIKDLSTYKEVKVRYPEAIILNEFDPAFRKNILLSYGLSEKMAEDLLWSEKLPLFEKFAEKYKNVKPTVICYLLFSLKAELKKEGIDQEPSEEVLDKILELLDNELITKEAVPKIISISMRENKDIETVINENNLWKLTKEKAKEAIVDFIKKNKQKGKRKLIAEIYKNFRYVVDGKTISEILKELDL